MSRRRFARWGSSIWEWVAVDMINLQNSTRTQTGMEPEIPSIFSRDISLVWCAGALLLAMLLLPVIAEKLTVQKPAPQHEPIKLHTTLVQVSVIVSERGGRYI